MKVILTILIVAVPGLITALIKSRNGKTWNLKKILLQWLFYAALISLILYGGLRAIGMNRFRLWEMSGGFLLKWSFLSLCLALFFGCVGISGLKREECRDRIRQIFPAALVLTVTLAVFSPGALFLNNINEFQISFFLVAPLILAAGLLLLAALCLLPLFFVKRELLRYYAAFLFGLALAVYCQTNFLNPELPALDGTPIDWTIYAAQNRMNILAWGLCLLLPLVLTFFKSEAVGKGISLLSWFFSAVQTVSLIALIFMNPVDNPGNYGLSKTDEFTVGARDNIVIFIVDTLQASVMDEYLQSEAYPEGALDDFTFFERAVSGGAPTYLGMPVLMTGSEYDPLESLYAYFEEAWADTPLYDELHQNGYDVRFFTEGEALFCVTDREADNYILYSKGVRMKDPLAFGVQLYKLAGFYATPVFMKEHFLLTTETMTDLLERSEEAYECDDVAFYQELQAAGALEVSYEKAFRLYHFRGVHEPYIVNENLEWVTEKPFASEQQTLQGNMKEIYLYLEQMKRAGVYDSSTVIIAGDHGRHEAGNPEANPAVLIKSPGKSHPLARSKAPIHFRNVTATMAMTMTDDYSLYGPSVYDITEESDVQRLHTVDDSVRKRNTIDDAWGRGKSACRFIVPQDPTDTANFQIWDPYQINRISYRTGDKIDFANNSGGAEQIDDRLYKEGNAAVAGSELSICFALTDAPDSDLNFHFTYDRIYGKQQQVRVYANGARVGTVTCTPEQAGSDCSVVIPQKRISEEGLVVRMVFPNAVTPNQLDRKDADTRVLSVAFDSMWIAP